MAAESSSYVRTAYLDTGGLWCLEEAHRPGEFGDNRWREYLAHLCDRICDPLCEIKCFFPAPEREGGPLPTFFHRFQELKLLKEATPLGKGELETDPQVLELQFREFERHIIGDRKAMASWYRLHDHPEIRDGWRKNLPDPSPNWEGVSRWLENFLLTKHSRDLEYIQQLTRWSKEKIAQLFSMIQRASRYADRAKKEGAEYLTHQTRWQVIPAAKAVQPDQSFGLVVGGITSASVGTCALSSDPGKLSETLARIRERAKPLGQQWREANTTSQLDDILHQLLDGLVGGELTEEGRRVYEATKATLLHSILRGIEGTVQVDIPLAAYFLCHWAALQVPTPTLSPDETSFLPRRWFNYSQMLDEKDKTCPRCGAILDAHRTCIPCAIRKEGIPKSAPS